MDEYKELAENLAARMADSVDLLDEMLPYVDDYFRDKWQFDERVAELRKPY